MIRIEKPFITTENGKSSLNAYITIDEERELIWFKVDEKYGQYLCDERGDAYLIAVLNYAMRNGHDIISEAPITEDLLYNIETYLIDGLIEYNPQFHRSVITAETASVPLPNAGAVGTGISCGVDSLHVLANEQNDKYPRHKITHLTFNNVGSHGEGEHARWLYEQRIIRPQQFAEEYGFEFVANDSNLMDVVKQSHFQTHTYSSMFAVYCLQKLYAIYYYASSGHKYHEFNLIDRGGCSGEYELLSLPVFSTHQLTIYSEGANKSRMEKMKSVATYVPSYKYLNVCLREGDNCGRCEKCVRTMMGLDAINALDRYKSVFDVGYYRGHHKWYMRQMLKKMVERKHDYFEIYTYFKKQMTLSLYLFKFSYRIYYSIKKTISRTSLYPSIKKAIR